MKNLSLTDNYRPKDSGLLFTIAFLIMNGMAFVYQLFSMIFFGNTYISIAVVQISLFLTCLIYSRTVKIPFFNALKIKPKIKVFPLIAAVICGISMLYVLYFPSFYFVELLKEIGYNYIDAEFTIITIWDFIFGTIFIALLPAVCEEIMFRGIILQGLRRYGDFYAVMVSSLFFMLFHTNPTQTLFPLLSGMVLGLIFVKTGDLKYCMIVHFLNNFQTVLFSYLMVEEIPFIAVIIGGLLFAAFMVYIFRQKSSRSKDTPAISAIYIPETLIYEHLVNLFIEKASQQNKEEQEEKKKVSNLYDEAVKLINRGFIYNPKKSTFTLYSSGEDNLQPQIEETPPSGFIDATKNPKYNPNYFKKKTFVAYAAGGIVLCITSWLLVFFLSDFVFLL